MANIFSNIRSTAGEQERSFRWYQDTVRKMAKDMSSFNNVSKTDLGELTSKLEPGNMYMFMYDPKYKDTLPYYDTFPLCLPFEDVSGGFVGINFHYLPFGQRALLLDNLLTFTDKKLTERSKIQASWGLLKNAGRFPQVKPAVKRYLYNNVKSSFLKITPEHWKSSIFLPTQSFEKASQQTVYQDTRDAING